MRIILDTNIVRQDFLLRSRKFEMLADFISKTTHSVVLPQVVYDELVALYRKELENDLSCYWKARDQLFRRLATEPKEEKLNIDIERQTSDFIRNLKKKFQFHKYSIVAHNEKHLPELVSRAIDRKPPFTRSKTEFRDALVWLSLFDIAEKFKTTKIAFISNNTKDFGTTDGSLHPELLAEGRKKGINLSFYTSLDGFLREYASKIEFVTKEWILSSIDIKELTSDLELIVDEIQLQNWVEWHEREDISEVSSFSVLSLDLSDFYVYEMADGSFVIEATFEGELEVEYQAEGEYDYCYPTIECEVHIIVDDAKIKEVELSDHEIL